ncbi:MmcB family DNA repair protein [Sphingomonas sp. MAH-20]|uniref:MmcB family DNA repair protein n=1 Tax=Sphingomonas horti TaxID=2682842 RepID=A0A6I4IXS1_9SPHN|nr:MULTISPECIES: MmcB family DNA repair protein [Sphingomonas]MBA2920911.1 MmcB family DNA repair protein [Sphingomonas sp. CGMCC 1.13658]MVO76897.1 MmcB family DNA repair protein [Sphingomonas horti]
MNAADVARGVSRLLLRHDYVALCEVPLGNGRRADLMAVDARGRIIIVEIKCSRADLLGDGKWRDYLDYCDRFFWAVPQGFDLSPFETEAFQPDVAGLIVADRYDAAIARDASEATVPAPRRKAATLDFARRAARRLLGVTDPECALLS